MKRTTIVALVGLGLAGCMTASQEKLILTGLTSNPRSVYVHYSVGTDGTMDVNSLQTLVKSGLQACGVASTGEIVRRRYEWAGANLPEVNPEAVIDKARANDAQAILTVSETSRTTMTQWGQTQDLGREFVVGFFDISVGRTVWKEKRYLSGQANPLRLATPQEKATALSSAVIADLAADKVLAGCPAPVAAP